MMRKTEIMATVPDVRCTPDFVRALHCAGMDAVRINSAHVDAVTFSRMVDVIRGTAPDVKILMDTKGPELRTTALPCEWNVSVADEVELCEADEDCSPARLCVAVDGISGCFRQGQHVIIDDGEVEFEIIDVTGHVARMKALNTGVIGSRKTIAFPGAVLPVMPAVSSRDREMISVACQCGIDMIAHSFVRSAADVRDVRRLIDGSGIRLYAKVECSEALEHLDEIAAAADGLLVARGDLGTQIPLSRIPGAQLMAVQAARRTGRSTMLATQILQSMITRPTPLRAELSDIFLAVAEGIDCLLLTGETATGDYPCECVKILDETIREAELLKCRILTIT